MVKVLVVYDSKTGNTEKMAFAVAEGAKQVNNVEVTVKRAEQTSLEDLLEADAIIMGSPHIFWANVCQTEGSYRRIHKDPRQA